MKHAVLVSDLKGEDIRPPVLFSKFRELSIADARTFFGGPGKLAEVDCPGCSSESTAPAFVKNGFEYKECSECGSLFVSPRPTEEALADYYANSSASRFRSEHYSRQTAESRRRLILRSNVGWMDRLLDEAALSRTAGYADVGTNYPIVFDVIRELGVFDDLHCVRPNVEPADESAWKDVDVRTDLPEGLGAVTAFEQLEHQFSPADFLASIYAALEPGGMLFFTTKTCSGFDLQTLGEKAPYIYVPEHLNLLSIEGLTSLVGRAGFELVELSTPGQLDVELVKLTLKDDPSIEVSKFTDYLLNHRDENARADFQMFLQKHRLSSHVRVAAVKR